MGNCLPCCPKPGIDTKIDADVDSNCCHDDTCSCGSKCCVIQIIRTNSPKNLKQTNSASNIG